MEPGLFYYSVNRTEVRGPVTWGILQQLFQDGLIGEDTQLCRELETDWHPLKAEAFRPTVTQGVAAKRPPKPRVPVPADDGYSHARLGQEPEEIHEWSLVESLGVAIALGTAAFLAMTVQSTGEGTSSIFYKFVVFVFFLFIFTIPPYLLSLFFRGLTRCFVMAGGVVILAVLTIAGKAAFPGEQKAAPEPPRALSLP